MKGIFKKAVILRMVDTQLSVIEKLHDSQCSDSLEEGLDVPEENA